MPNPIAALAARLAVLAVHLHARLTATADAASRYAAAKRAQLRAEPDAGYSTEAVIVTALLVALGITAVGIIAAKVIGKAKSLNF